MNKKQIFQEAIERRAKAHCYYREAMCHRSLGNQSEYTLAMKKFSEELKQAIFDLQVNRMNFEREHSDYETQFLEAAE